MPKATTLPIRLELLPGSTLKGQIYESIRAALVDGLIAEGTRVPSTRALADHLGVSRNTVLSALSSLQDEGYLVARQGSGTFVADELPDRSTPPAPALPPRTAHPLLSRRGDALASARFPDRRILGPRRAFRLGTPGLDLFPWRLWSQTLQRCARTVTSTQLDYSDLRGCPELRREIAEQVRARGTTCHPDQVIIFAGLQRALEFAFHVLLDPGDAAWIEDPGYPGAYAALLSAGARAIPVPVDAHGIHVSALSPEARDVRLAYVTPSHQFPLGVRLSLERRLQLLAWARQSGAWIIEDDYDCDFRYEARPLTCLHALDPDGRVLYAGTFSKTLFPGLRLGYLIVPSDLTRSFTVARFASDVHPPLIEQLALARFMAEGHYARHLRRMQSAYGERLDALQRAVAQTGAALALRPVRSGLHAVGDLDGADAELVWRVAHERGIETMPLGHFCFGDRPAPQALVLGFASCKAGALRIGVSRLAAVIDAVRAGRAGRPAVHGLRASAPT